MANCVRNHHGQFRTQAELNKSRVGHHLECIGQEEEPEEKCDFSDVTKNNRSCRNYKPIGYCKGHDGSSDSDIGHGEISQNNVGQGIGHEISEHHAAWSSYVTAIRPNTLNLSLVPVALGCALAYKSTSEFSLVIWIVTCLTAVSVHAAGNVVNTYYDYEKGVDSKKSDDRTLVDKILTPDSIVQLGALLYLFGCVGFIGLVLISPAKMEHLALAYFGGLSSSFLYTGGIGFKYIALGDLLVLIIFGPVVVLFSYIAQTGQLHPIAFYYAMPLALISEAALHCNNARDVTTDQKAGIVTVAILIGPTFSYALFALLLFTPYVVLAVMGILYCPTLLLPLITIPRAFHLEKEFRLRQLKTLPAETAKLSLYFGLFYVLACVVAAPGRLPGI
ncbi:hypothetical protein CHUAL_001473 [Chamberlinius hualienensis]